MPGKYRVGWLLCHLYPPQHSVPAMWHTLTLMRFPKNNFSHRTPYFTPFILTRFSIETSHLLRRSQVTELTDLCRLKSTTGTLLCIEGYSCSLGRMTVSFSAPPQTLTRFLWVEIGALSIRAKIHWSLKQFLPLSVIQL